MQLFLNDYGWYKGNLHTHTTLSDGLLSAREVISYYKSKGYDFLAITDHEKYYPGGFEDNMLVLPGIEIAYNDNVKRIAYHILGIDTDDGVRNYPEEGWQGDAQKMIDHIKSHGGMAIVCHPDWSLMGVEDVRRLHDYDAVEIMNVISDPDARGNSANFCDALMARGEEFLTIASDDSHFYNGDAGYSAIYVNAASCEKKDIMEAIYAGRFYSSCGPTFKSIRIENGYIYVSASPVRLIRFMSDNFYTPYRRHVCRMTANSAEYPIGKMDNFVRVELEDENGKRAWSQYIDVREFK